MPGKPSSEKLPKKAYETELYRLQSELVKMQNWARASGARIAVVFEGRDAAGKGGTITRIMQYLNPRFARIAALDKPTDLERTQWYFQRYVSRLPAGGEIVLFDRSWYNRAGVERVMGFCTKEEYARFMHQCPIFERMLVEDGVLLRKYWFSVSDTEQQARFESRLDDPVRRWKLSPMDLESVTRWEDYSRAKDDMFTMTDIPEAPWYVVESDVKRRARINMIAHLLSTIPYHDVPEPKLKLPRRPASTGYVRTPLEMQTFVPDHAAALLTSRRTNVCHDPGAARPKVANSRQCGKLVRVSNGELRQRAAELGVSVSYWDWQGREVIVSDETLTAIVTALEDAPPANTAFAAPESVAPVPAERSWGFAVQLYSLRSRGSWGHGDLRDLADLATWSARDLGAGFVLINPLHAAEPLPPVSASPYLPMSRHWVSPLYLRIEDIPEYKDLSYPERRRLTVASQPLREASQTPALIDRDAVWTAKREALDMLRKVPLSDERQASFEEFRARHGQALEHWASWCALAEVHGPDYRTWPSHLQDPRSAQTEVRRGDLAAQAEFHTWVQWLVASQVEAAQAAARAAGMAIGIIADLAIGAHPGGADAWAGQEFFAKGFTVGAPPDAFNQRGQDWGLPPMHPRALASAGYKPLADLVNANVSLGGGLRIDHVMGLSRLWWIPAGAPPTEGAYVYYDAPGTLGTLAASAAATKSVVIGEDLGTVEPWLRDALAARGVLGTMMLWFERGLSDEPLAPQWWRANSLVTVSTHDVPPAAAFLSGSQVTDRLNLGLLTRSEAEERAEADRTVNDWIGACVSQGLLLAGRRPTADEFTVALYGYLAKTPAKLIGVNLAEATGETRSQNMPGTCDEYPNWKLPLSGPDGKPVLLEDLSTSVRVRAVARAASGA